MLAENIRVVTGFNLPNTRHPTPCDCLTFEAILTSTRFVPLCKITVSFFLGHTLAQKDTQISIFMYQPITFFLTNKLLRVGEKCLDDLSLISVQVFHTSSLQLGIHKEALRFNISEPFMYIRPVKTRDLNT